MHDFHGTLRDLLHAANLRHGTDGFTSPPKEGVLRIFFALKIWRLRPGLNPRTWVLKACTLPLEHRSRFFTNVGKIKLKKLTIFFCLVEHIICVFTDRVIWWPVRNKTGASFSSSNILNLLKTKCNLVYIRNQSVPRCKHFPAQL